MSKILVVATHLQQHLLNDILLSEIKTGFWNNARPADHGQTWADVFVEVGTDLGPKGFTSPRNYNFLNYDFFEPNEAALLQSAQAVQPTITVKQLKKELIELNRIIGGRIKVHGGEITKLQRGRKADPNKASAKTDTSVKRAAAVFADEGMPKAA